MVSLCRITLHPPAPCRKSNPRPVKRLLFPVEIFRWKRYCCRYVGINREAGMKIIRISVFVLALASGVWAQSDTGSGKKSHPGATHDIASGTGNVVTRPVKG